MNLYLVAYLRILASTAIAIRISVESSFAASTSSISSRPSSSIRGRLHPLKYQSYKESVQVMRTGILVVISLGRIKPVPAGEPERVRRQEVRAECQPVAMHDKTQSISLFLSH